MNNRRCARGDSYKTHFVHCAYSVPVNCRVKRVFNISRNYSNKQWFLRLAENKKFGGNHINRSRVIFFCKCKRFNFKGSLTNLQVIYKVTVQMYRVSVQIYRLFTGFPKKFTVYLQGF